MHDFFYLYLQVNNGSQQPMVGIVQPSPTTMVVSTNGRSSSGFSSNGAGSSAFSSNGAGSSGFSSNGAGSSGFMADSTVEGVEGMGDGDLPPQKRTKLEEM